MKKRPVLPGMPARILTIIFGLFLCLALLELGLRLGGFAVLSLQERGNRAAIRQKWSYRIMCLGESSTALGGVYSYPRQLQDILNRRKIGVKFSVINKGVIGIRTSEILNRLESDLDAYRPDMVIAMMGINDRGTYMFSGGESGSKAVNFLKSLRIYKLARIFGARTAVLAKGPVKYKLIRENVKPEKPGEVISQPAKSGEAPLPGRLSIAEVVRAETIDRVPENDKAYLESGWISRAQGRRSDANARGLDPGSSMACFELGWVYERQARYPEAEGVFKKAIELAPQDYWPYAEIGRFYLKQDKFPEADAAFRKAAGLNPGNAWPYIGLGQSYHAQGRLPDAEALFRKAIELDPGNKWAYIGMKKVYAQQSRHFEPVALFKKAIESNPQEAWPYFELGQVYRSHGSFFAAEPLFKKALELDPANGMICRTLKLLYVETGNAQIAGEYDRMANELKADDYPAMVIDDYQRLKAALDKRGITYVCAQYPMRSLEPLKKIFRGEQGIVFVDNEKLFKEAVQKGGYQEYFVDTCNGDFGHCTPKGNRLLAENIANAILDSVFFSQKRY
ncbi:MAG: tetratricopeptide repeat protein [Candidatus Omnitrophica bacterium]|nr:tetratricopeptide repeat protein [Candidatus Omnitrophota bacterium]